MQTTLPEQPDETMGERAAESTAAAAKKRNTKPWEREKRVGMVNRFRKAKGR